jgi:micrococcal nuclease
VRFLCALYPQGVRRQTLRKGRCAAAGNPPAYPLRVLALRAVLALLLLCASAVAGADTLAGVVIVVIDGDTVLFKPDHTSPSSRAFIKVRLADIDAPEKDQPYGDAATRALTALVLKQPVELDTLATDIYGRTIARIRLGTLQVDAELVRRGHAWASSRDAESAMRNLQREAHAARIGLWADADPTPPWVWRRAHPSTADHSPSR